MASVWLGSSVLAHSRVRLTRWAPVRVLPNGLLTLFNEGKGFNKCPTAPKNAQLKADALSPNLQRFPNGNGIHWASSRCPTMTK